MRLALVAGRFPVLSETFIYNHAAGLKAAGIDVTVVAARPSKDAGLFADFDGLAYDGPIRGSVITRGLTRTAGRALERIVQSGPRGMRAWDQARRRYGTTRRAMRAWLLALPLLDFDIVHFEYSGLALRWFDAIELLRPAKIVVSCRGAAEQITPLVQPARADRLRDLFAAVDRAHCVSDDMVRTCARYGLDPRKAFVNRPAIDARRFARTSPYVAKTTGPYALLSTGRLHWKKGIEFALLAVRRLLDRGRDVVFHIIGGGSDEERLRFATHDLALENNVIFHGRKSSSEVRAALEKADVYLLPSVSEGLSNAALEAMAMELPVVATTSGGMAEAIRDNVDGLLVPSRAPEAMADRIDELLGNPALRTSLALASRKRIEDAFSLERQIRVYLTEYAALSVETA